MFSLCLGKALLFPPLALVAGELRPWRESGLVESQEELVTSRQERCGKLHIVLASRWSRAGMGRGSCRSRRPFCLHPCLPLSQEELLWPCPALEGSHLSCRLSFCFPLPARGSVPKLSWDEGKPFPGLPPCTSTCRKLSTAQQGGLMSVKAFILASPLVHACPRSHVHRHAHTLLCLAVDYFEQWRSSTYLCSPSISPKLVQHHHL